MLRLPTTDNRNKHANLWYASAIIVWAITCIFFFTLFPSPTESILVRAINKIERYKISREVSREEIQNYIQKNSLPPINPQQDLIATGPLRVNYANPRYFMDGEGKTIYLTGSHTWLNLQDGVLADPPPPFDYETWLNFLQSQQHSFFRLWVWEQAKWSVEEKSPYYHDPLPYQRIESISDPALDGKPKFDLTKFNQEYFERLRRRVIAAGQKGIYMSIMLFNGWSVAYPKSYHKDNNPWLGHPYNKNNNINGIDGDLNGDNSGVEVHELRNIRITNLQEAYVRKVIDTVNDLDNVLYEISNESHSGSINWQYHMINFIHNYESGKPKQHPVGMTVTWPNGDNTALYASNADWISPNGALYNRPSADGRKVVIADTDHLCGICGDRQWVWMSFTRGENPLFMDQYNDSYKLEGGGYNLNNPNDVTLRKNLGYTRQYAERLNLAAMAPHGELTSSGYALANPVANGAQYLVYLPEGGSVEVDLSRTNGTLNVEWFNPATGILIQGGTTTGADIRSFKTPFNGDAILYIYSD